MRAHVDFADGTSAWVDMTSLLPKQPRWRYEVDGEGCGFAVDTEHDFPRIKLSEHRNRDVSYVAEILRALERLYPKSR